MRDMPGASPVPHRRSSTAARTGEARRVATVAMLLVVTVVGLRTRGAFSHTPDAAAAGATGAVLATALAACEGVAFVAFIVLLVAARPQRRPRDEQEPERLLFPWWAKTAGVLLALGLLVTPFVLLLSLKVRKHTPVPPVAHLVNPVSRSQPPNAAAQSSAWPLIAGLVIAIAGSAALQANHEPRAAIIVCYAAMEQGFAAAGSAAAAADTPAEVLARATAAGSVRAGAAAGVAGPLRR